MVNSMRNKYHISTYAGQHIFWGLLSMVWYRSLLFRRIPNCSYEQSILILWLLFASFIILGFLFTAPTHRNTMNLVITLLIPYEVYATISLGKYFLLGIYCSAAIGAVLSILLALWVLLAPIKQTANRKRTVMRRLYQTAVNTRVIVPTCLSSILVFCAITQLNGGIPVAMNALPSIDESVESETIANHIETLCLLQTETWAGLSSEERLSVMQVVANIERRYLGIFDALVVKTDVLEEGTVATYEDATNRITIDIGHLEEDSPEEILNSVAHECYHAYQHVLVDLYLDSSEEYRSLQVFNTAREYLDEYSDYADGGSTEQEFMEYYFQTVEITARAYADDAVGEYFTRIDAYLAASDNEETE